MTRDDETEAERDRPSKSSRKRAAASLQDLGVELAEMNDGDIDALGLPDKLATALKDLKRLPTHGAKVRQRQYIGKLMRRIDPEPLLAMMAERKRQHDADIRKFQKIERWRERLLADPAAHREFLEDHPQADAGTLQALMTRAAEERARAGPPAAARELFAFLRRLLG